MKETQTISEEKTLQDYYNQSKKLLANSIQTLLVYISDSRSSINNELSTNLNFDGLVEKRKILQDVQVTLNNPIDYDHLNTILTFAEKRNFFLNEKLSYLNEFESLLNNINNSLKQENSQSFDSYSAEMLVSNISYALGVEIAQNEEPF